MYRSILYDFMLSWRKKQGNTCSAMAFDLLCDGVSGVLLGMLGVIEFFLAAQVAGIHRKHIIISKLSHYEYTHLCNEILMILYMI